MAMLNNQMVHMFLFEIGSKMIKMLLDQIWGFFLWTEFRGFLVLFLPLVFANPWLPTEMVDL